MLDVERRRLSFQERLAHIQRELEEISAHHESLTDGARDLLGQTKLLMEMVLATMDRRWTFLEGVERRSKKSSDLQKIRLIEDLQDVLRELGTQIIPVLDGGRPHYIPFEIDPIIQQVVRLIAGDDLTPVLYSSHAYNYSIKNKARFLQVWREKLRATDEGPIDGMSSGFVWIATPRLERDSATLHATALGHELGHLRDWKEGVSSHLLSIEPVSRFKGKTRAVKLEKLKENIVEHNRYTGLRKRWLQELVADVFSAFLLGPAALFCLAELASSVRPLNWDSDTHPGPDRRLLLMIRVLKDHLKFDEIRPLGALIQDVENSVSGALSRETHMSGEAPTYAWESCSALLDRIVADCKTPLAEADIFDRARWKDVEAAAGRLERLLPHGEYKTKTNWAYSSYRVILNAAWLVKLTRIDSVRGHLGLSGEPALARRIYARSILDGLVLKSFEISTYRRRAGE